MIFVLKLKPQSYLEQIDSIHHSIHGISYPCRFFFSEKVTFIHIKVHFSANRHKLRFGLILIWMYSKKMWLLSWKILKLLDAYNSFFNPTMLAAAALLSMVDQSPSNTILRWTIFIQDADWQDIAKSQKNGFIEKSS